MEKLNFSQLQKNEKPCRHVLIYKYRKLIWIQISFWGFNLMVWRKISAVRYAVSVFSLTNPETNDVYRFSFNRFPLSLPSADGEPSLPEYSSEREGDADLLYLHGEEQQEPLGPERGRWQTPGLNFPTTITAAATTTTTTTVATDKTWTSVTAPLHPPAPLWEQDTNCCCP